MLNTGVKDSNNRHAWSIDIAKPLQLPDVELPLDPYLLGYWLGDGSCNAPRINAGDGDAKVVMANLDETHHNYEVIQIGKRTKQIIIDPGQSETAGLFASILEELNLFQYRHIPAIYMRASYWQRMELLSGLLDSNATISESGTCEWYGTNGHLAAQVQELLASVGIRSTVRFKENYRRIRGMRNTGHGIRVITFTTYADMDCFKLNRKSIRLKERTPGNNWRTNQHFIKAITPVESVPVKCIGVANKSHLYLAGKTLIPTHNTLSLLDGVLAWLLTSNPSDTLVVHMTEASARKFSRMRVARLIRNSPKIRSLQTANRDDDNILFKQFRNGMSLVIGSPAPTNLSASDYKFVMLSDYDRMPDDNGEGSVFTQAQKRTQTFMSAGMTIVESSPGRDHIDPEWKASGKHEAPPVGGILGLYNDGDRRMWYWDCPECNEPFPVRPGNSLFCLPKDHDLLVEIEEHGTGATARKYAHIYCPNCGARIEERSKYKLNLNGRWIAENPDDKNTTASYWLGGVAAKFQSWHSILDKYFKAIVDFNNTGEDRKIKAVLNVDMAMPFTPYGISNKLTSKELEDRAEDIPKREVPFNGAALFASVDVQKHHFAVYVECIMNDGSKVVIDRYDIRRSLRLINNEPALLDPAAYVEDWDVLIEKVIKMRYPITDTTTPELDMGIVMTVCDSGGKEGVTENAYRFWKKVKSLGLSSKFNLVKGEQPAPSTNKPSIHESIMDKSSSAARKAGVVGTQRVWILNTTMIKDAVSANLKRTIPGTDYVRFPEWLPSTFYKELTVEVRDGKGWHNLVRQPNESFDLMVYAKAAFMIKKSKFGNKEIDWAAPPYWLGRHEINPEVAPVGKFDTVALPGTTKARKVRMRRKR
jgi:phage terminase large subunit GpA-like protein